MTEISLIGKKIGMTREFYKTGQSVPVTVIKMEKGRVIDIISEEKRGYKAVQIGFGKIKNSKISKAMKGYFTKKNTEPKKKLKEFRVKNLENYKEGNELGLEIFKDVKFVDIRSTTIGKGFAGAMKRHNFAGLRASHGVSISHRAHGSTGQNQDPGKVFKNKKMAGHMGNKLRTMQNIEIIKSDNENNLLYLKGSIPGAKNSEIMVKKSGFLVFEIPDCTAVFDSQDYTTIWEDHISYFTPETFQNTLVIGGYNIYHFKTYPYPFENSLVAIVQPNNSRIKHNNQDINVDDELKRVHSFANNLDQKREQLNKFLSSFRQNHGKIAIFGAGHLACMFINLMGIKDLIEFVVDDHPNKRGLFMPGSKLPIYASDYLIKK